MDEIFHQIYLHKGIFVHKEKKVKSYGIYKFYVKSVHTHFCEHEYRDNKWFFVLGLGTTLTCFKQMTVWPKTLKVLSLYEKSIEIDRLMNYIYIKASSNSACGMKSRWKCT